MAIAKLTHLSYWYPGSVAPALRSADLSIAEGLTVVTGPSGGGKSTLLRVFNGLVPHFHGGRIAGSARVFDQDVIQTRTRDLARSVGFVFQDPELQTVYDTVDREIAFGLENMALPPLEIWNRVDEALEAAGIPHLAARAVRSLSGGERQRVALASSLAMRPHLVVLDEPTSQLDPDGVEMVLSSVLELVRAGRSVVISEHRLDRLMPSAHLHVVIGGARVDSHDPRSWRRATVPARPPRLSSPGEVTWSLDGATASLGGQVVLHDVDLDGRAGEIVVLAGPNGGGKTTLLRLIAGAVAPVEGRVERRPGRIAYLPQNPAAILHRPTLRAEVRMTLERSREDERPESILEELGLLGAADRYPRDLSSGERQRAALAAVLPGRPALVLLDEPTRGMDSAARSALIGLVSRLRDAGAAVVLATHDDDLRAALADRVVWVAGQRVTETALEVVGR